MVTTTSSTAARTTTTSGGGPGDDTITAGDGDDVVDGNTGNDTIHGGTGTDTISGGPGGDTITAGDGDDVVDGNRGDDIIKGGTGDDIISGGPGNDDIRGGDGGDTIRAGKDDDVVGGGPGPDLVTGGPGHDTCTSFHGTGCETFRAIDAYEWQVVGAQSAADGSNVLGRKTGGFLSRQEEACPSDHLAVGAAVTRKLINGHFRIDSVSLACREVRQLTKHPDLVKGPVVMVGVWNQTNGQPQASPSQIIQRLDGNLQGTGNRPRLVSFTFGYHDITPNGPTYAKGPVVWHQPIDAPGFFDVFAQINVVDCETEASTATGLTMDTTTTVWGVYKIEVISNTITGRVVGLGIGCRELERVYIGP